LDLSLSNENWLKRALGAVLKRDRSNSGASLVDAAKKSLGIIQLPDYYVETELRAGRLVSVLDRHRAPEDGIWAIYPQNRHLAPKVRLLLEHLGKGLR
jgi:DNA-binding transcriptional LysR family regulator